MCVFARQNVAADPPFSHLDLISCRNVLIYLAPPLQQRVLPIFHYALNPAGFLVLGTRRDRRRARRPVRAGRPADTRSTPKKPASRSRSARPVADELRARSAGAARRDRADRADAARLPARGRPRPARPLRARPACWSTSDFDILQFRGRTGAVPRAARRASRRRTCSRWRARACSCELRSALRRGQAERGTVVRRGACRVREPTAGRSTRSTSRSLPGQAAARGGAPMLPGPVPTSRRRPSAPARGRRAERRRPTATPTTTGRCQLRQELVGDARVPAVARSSSRRPPTRSCASANEEILSSNEELQSTNEELETAKEELQSANEELTTVNEELQHRNLELAQANNDLTQPARRARASRSSWSAATCASAASRRRREKVLNLLPGGRRPPDRRHQAGRLDARPRGADRGGDRDRAAGRARGPGPRRAAGTRLRVHPYRTAGPTIDGAVIVLVDIDEIKGAEEALREADRRKDEFLAMLAHELRNPLAPIRNALADPAAAPETTPATLARRASDGRAAGRSTSPALVDDLLDVSRIAEGKIELRRERLDLARGRRAARSTLSRAHHRGRPARPRASARRRSRCRLDADPLRLDAGRWSTCSTTPPSTPSRAAASALTRRAPARRRRRGRPPGAGHGRRHRRRRCCPTSSSCSPRATAALDAQRRAGSGIGLTLVKSLVRDARRHASRRAATGAGPGQRVHGAPAGSRGRRRRRGRRRGGRPVRARAGRRRRAGSSSSTTTSTRP